MREQILSIGHNSHYVSILSLRELRWPTGHRHRVKEFLSFHWELQELPQGSNLPFLIVVNPLGYRPVVGFQPQ